MTDTKPPKIKKLNVENFTRENLYTAKGQYLEHHTALVCKTHCAGNLQCYVFIQRGHRRRIFRKQ